MTMMTSLSHKAHSLNQINRVHQNPHQQTDTEAPQSSLSNTSLITSCLNREKIFTQINSAIGVGPLIFLPEFKQIALNRFRLDFL